MYDPSIDEDLGDPDAPETSGLAIAAMVLAVLLISLPVLGQIIGLLFAWRARVDIRRSGGYLRGRELARAAEIVSTSVLMIYLLGAVLLAIDYVASS